MHLACVRAIQVAQVTLRVKHRYMLDTLKMLLLTKMGILDSDTVHIDYSPQHLQAQIDIQYFRENKSHCVVRV